MILRKKPKKRLHFSQHRLLLVDVSVCQALEPGDQSRILDHISHELSGIASNIKVVDFVHRRLQHEILELCVLDHPVDNERQLR